MTDTSKLEGRELAVACARAMGLKVHEAEVYSGDDRWRGPVTGERCDDCWQMHTGMPKVDEMLAWLGRKAEQSKADICVNVTFSEEKSYVLFADNNRSGECGVDYVFERVAMRPGFHPEDLHEALQRLVVAVAEGKR